MRATPDFDFALPESAEMIRAVTARFADEQIAPLAARADADPAACPLAPEPGPAASATAPLLPQPAAAEPAAAEPVAAEAAAPAKARRTRRKKADAAEADVSEAPLAAEAPAAEAPAAEEAPAKPKRTRRKKADVEAVPDLVPEAVTAVAEPVPAAAEAAEPPAKAPAVIRKLKAASIDVVVGPTGSPQVLASLAATTQAKTTR